MQIQRIGGNVNSLSKGWRGQSFLNILNICNIAAQWPSAVSKVSGGDSHIKCQALRANHALPLCSGSTIVICLYKSQIFFVYFPWANGQKPRPSLNLYSDRPCDVHLLWQCCRAASWTPTFFSTFPSAAPDAAACESSRPQLLLFQKVKKFTGESFMTRMRSLMHGPSVARADRLS